MNQECPDIRQTLLVIQYTEEKESAGTHHCHPIQLVRNAPRGAPQVTPIIDTVVT